MADASPAGSGAPGTRHCASIVASGPRRGEIILGAVPRRTRFAAFDHTRLADMLLSRLT
jgi:hypothetical protein